MVCSAVCACAPECGWKRMIGQTFYHYRVLEELGRGAMGIVYRAHDENLRRDVALKILPEGTLRDKHSRKRFRNEALSLSRLNHPNIEIIYDFETVGEVDVLVTEYVPGINLNQKLASGALPEDEIIDLAGQLVQGVAAAHEKSVVHCDLKPSNLRVTPEGRLKILDFGLAKFLEPPDTTAETASQTELESIAGGTLPYMAPERLHHRKAEVCSDIYAIGVILYEMATGQRPFAETYSPLLIDAILHKTPCCPRMLNPQISPALENIIIKAMDKDPRRRYASATDMLADIEALGAPVPPGATVGVRTLAAPVRSWAHKRPYSRRWPMLAAALVIVTAAIILLFSRYQGAGADSIAVMPFTYVNTDAGVPANPDSEYLSDGITETLINTVSQFPDVKVIAATSVFRYKGRALDIRSVGDELKVRKVLTGRIVQHRDNLTISLELVDAANNHHLWGERIESNINALPSVPREIALEVSNRLRTRLRPQSVKSYTQDSEAYQAYLKGRYYWNKRTEADLQKAISYFRQAVAEDPQYALAYAGLADSYLLLGVYSNIKSKDAIERARSAALKAVENDNALAEGHTSLAVIAGDGDWDFITAEREFRRALELNPNYATAHQWYGESLTYVGRFDEALREIRTAMELDPLSLPINATAGDMLIRMHRYDEAIAQLGKTIELDKNFPAAHSALRNAYEYKHMFNKAIGEHEAAAVAQGYTAEQAKSAAATLRAAYAKSGEAGYWRARVQLAQQDIRRGTVTNYDESPFRMASFYAHIGNTESAIQWLEKALDERDISLVYVRTAPEFQALLSDPRVVNIVQHKGLPQ